MERRCFITIVRHGETSLNVLRLLQGHTNTPLSEVGMSQAELLGKKLSQEKFTRAFSSDLNRAYTTAKLILQHSGHQNLEIKQDSRLRERCYGAAEGKPAKQLFEEAQKLNLSVTDYTPEGGESGSGVMLRAQSFFEDICQFSEGKEDENILVVTHGGWIQYLMQLFHKSEDKYSLEGFNPGKAIKIHRNTAVSKLSIKPIEKPWADKPKYTLVFQTIDDIQHLESKSLVN